MKFAVRIQNLAAVATPLLDTGRSVFKQMVLSSLVSSLFESGPEHLTMFSHHHRHHHERLNLCDIKEGPGLSIFVLVSPHHDLQSGDTLTF